MNAQLLLDSEITPENSVKIILEFRPGEFVKSACHHQDKMNAYLEMIRETMTKTMVLQKFNEIIGRVVCEQGEQAEVNDDDEEYLVCLVNCLANMNELQTIRLKTWFHAVNLSPLKFTTRLSKEPEWKDIVRFMTTDYQADNNFLPEPGTVEYENYCQNPIAFLFK